MRFCTAINCMDGRVQLPLIEFMQKRFRSEFVDMVTEPGPALILARQCDSEEAASILRRAALSVDVHSSGALALAAHYDCAGNPADEQEQKQHLAEGITFLRTHFSTIPVIGVWIDHQWNAAEVT